MLIDTILFAFHLLIIINIKDVVIENKSTIFFIFRLWQAHAMDGMFSINLCGHQMGNFNCPASSAICLKNMSASAVNIGSYTDSPTMRISNGGYRFGFTLEYASHQKCKSNKNSFVNSSITFTCGKTLVSIVMT